MSPEQLSLDFIPPQGSSQEGLGAAGDDRAGDAMLPPIAILMDQWVDAGWMRRVDRAVGRWLEALCPETDARVILAAVLTSHQAGQGHVCLDLAACLDDPDTVLKMPPQSGVLPEDGIPPVRPAQLMRGWRLADWVAVLADARSVVALAEDPQPPTIGDPESAGVSILPDAPPFVLDGGLLYLRRYWVQEQAIAEQVRRRVSAESARLDVRHVREVLDRLFDPMSVDPAEPDWQKIACALSIRRPFSIITGGPGTGKTTTVVKLLLMRQILAFRAGQPPLRIRLSAPTGKAAARLKQSIQAQIVTLLPRFAETYPRLADTLPQTVETLHRLIGVRPNQPRPVHHAGNYLPADIVVIDEASMIGQELMARTLAALAPDTSLVLLGDRDQLASVEPGSVLGALCAHADAKMPYDAETVEWIRQTVGVSLPAAAEPGASLDQAIATLRYSHRFGPDSPIGTLARAINAGDASATRRVLQAASSPGEAIGLLPDDRQAHGLTRLAVEALSTWLKRVQSPPSMVGAAQDDWARAIFAAHQETQILCALRQGRQGVEGVNLLVEQALYRAGLLPGFGLREGAWYAGRPILVTRNEPGLRLANGDIGLTLPYRDDAGREPVLRVAFPGDDPTAPIRWLNPHRLPSCETAFALTVHKAQGSEFGHAVFVLPAAPNPILTRELIYTALTRARDRFTLVASDADPSLSILADGVRRRVQRAGQLERLCAD
ncbi:exodeoxyribonuclease V subunit alpha [Halothiobacillus diazotrophicus]|nr:exodeoxyribonuclease V subunit alpha [Halothiobacillus diazotrophicus]